MWRYWALCAVVSGAGLSQSVREMPHLSRGGVVLGVGHVGDTVGGWWLDCESTCCGYRFWWFLSGFPPRTAENHWGGQVQAWGETIAACGGPLRLPGPQSPPAAPAGPHGGTRQYLLKYCSSLNTVKPAGPNVSMCTARSNVRKQEFSDCRAGQCAGPASGAGC